MRTHLIVVRYQDPNNYLHRSPIRRPDEDLEEGCLLIQSGGRCRDYADQSGEESNTLNLTSRLHKKKKKTILLEDSK